MTLNHASEENDESRMNRMDKIIHKRILSILQIL